MTDPSHSLADRLEKAIDVPEGPWSRPKREGHKVNRLIVSKDGQTIAWIGHGNDQMAEAIADYLTQCAPNAALRRSSPEAGMKEAGWQPIESAPKDGTHILVWAECVADEEDEDRRVIRKNVIEHYAMIAYWIDFCQAFAEFPFRNSFPVNQRFTHWMPLPASPIPTSDTRGEKSK